MQHFSLWNNWLQKIPLMSVKLRLMLWKLIVIWMICYWRVMILLSLKRLRRRDVSCLLVGDLNCASGSLILTIGQFCITFLRKDPKKRFTDQCAY